MAVSKFAISAANASSGQPASKSLFVIGGPLIAAVILVSGVSSTSEWMIAAYLAPVALLLLNRVTKGRKEKSYEATVTVYPIGVQLARMQRSCPVGPPLFIPRDLILDVIVNEVILAHKVVSVVAFRVLKQDAKPVLGAKDSVQPSISLLLTKGCIQLVPAFTGVEMSFADCQRMRREISACLGLV